MNVLTRKQWFLSIKKVSELWRIQSRVMFNCFLIQIEQLCYIINSDVLTNHFLLEPNHINYMINVCSIQSSRCYIFFSNSFSFIPFLLTSNPDFLKSVHKCINQDFRFFWPDFPCECVLVVSFPFKGKSKSFVKISPDF